MVQVTICSSTSKSWILFEFQGTLQLTNEDPVQSLMAKLPLGQLLSCSRENQILLQMGPHRLHGVRESLAHPLAVLRPVAENNEHTEGQQQDGAGKEDQKDFTIQGLIREKWVFRQRPQHVVAMHAS